METERQMTGGTVKGDVSILVVDDEEIIRDLLVEHLTDVGFKAAAVPSGEEALDIFRNNRDLVVITDIRMEGMSGIELLKEIKEIDEDAVVIIITSHAGLDSAIAALKSGAYDYIFKPFEDLDQITGVVSRALEKAILIRQNKQLIENLERSNLELELSREVFRDLAIRDGLTGLFNHRQFKDLLGSELNRAERYRRPLCLIMLDVDHFKIYNDTNGHPEGDILLKTLAGILRDRIRDVDIATRYGGEEFAILLPETDKEKGKIVAEDIRNSVEKTVFKGGKSQPLGKVTVSLGVAGFPVDGTDRGSLVKKADEALYRAKNAGRNLVFCSPD
jgi:diguanylate cyclase (GGDEF)-like protein